jgi:hypothetical protein
MEKFQEGGSMMTMNPGFVSRWHRCALLVLGGLVLFAFSAHGASHPWEKVEIVLTAAKDYPNPYVDVEAWVELSGPGFTKRCYGFWDGGSTYRVRVVATAPGQWTWCSGSNQDDPGLNGQTGSFVATAWSEARKRENPTRELLSVSRTGQSNFEGWSFGSIRINQEIHGVTCLFRTLCP